MQGYIHQLESFGCADGPGSRFIIFFAGFCNVVVIDDTFIVFYSYTFEPSPQISSS